jgi:hypothetical protein
MKHTEKYLQAKWVTENPDGYDERDVVDAKRYCNAYLDGYNQALRIHDVMVRSEQLPPDHITDKEYKELMKVLYPKNNSKRFSR